MLYIHAIVLVVGTFHVYTSRSNAALDKTCGESLCRFMAKSNASLHPEVEQWVARSNWDSELSANALLAVAYYVAPVHELDYILKYNNDAGPFFGRYQIWPAERLIQMLLGPSMAPDTPDSYIHRSGLYFTIWGGMYLDFGYAGSFVVLFLCGILSGSWGRRAFNEGDQEVRAYIVLIIVAVILSPAHSFIAFGNSVFIIGWFIMLYALRRFMRSERESRAKL